MKKPLMVLTSSDIGTDPVEVEQNLTREFKKAKSWEAVLLIDEADVFMEQRSTKDLERNSLVAGKFLCPAQGQKLINRYFRISSSSRIL